MKLVDDTSSGSTQGDCFFGGQPCQNSSDTILHKPLAGI